MRGVQSAIKRLLRSLALFSIATSVFVGAGGAAPGTVLFSDDFNGGSASRWVVDQGNWSVVNGAYYQTNSEIFGSDLDPALGGRMISHVAGSNYGDFDATVEAQVVSSLTRQKELAVIFRAQDLQNFYHFRWLTGNLDGDDHMELWKYVNGTPILITQIRMAPTPIGTKLVFKLSARGSQFTIQIQAKGKGASSSRQLTATDSTYASGFFGLATYYTRGYFDNVVITA